MIKFVTSAHVKMLQSRNAFTMSSSAWAHLGQIGSTSMPFLDKFCLTRRMSLHTFHTKWTHLGMNLIFHKPLQNFPNNNISIQLPRCLTTPTPHGILVHDVPQHLPPSLLIALPRVASLLNAS